MELVAGLGGTSHKSATSTGTGNKQTIAADVRANYMMLSAKTNNARVTFDGTDPSVGSKIGLIIIAGAQPALMPFSADIEFVSEAAADSELNVLYLV